jgi:hypothetical protein
MNERNLELTRSIDAVFSCEGPIVRFHFLMNGEQAGRNFVYSRSVATALGKQIAATGEWEEFPIDGVPVEGLSKFRS